MSHEKYISESVSGLALTSKGVFEGGGTLGLSPPRTSEIHSFQVRMERKIFKSSRTNS